MAAPIHQTRKGRLGSKKSSNGCTTCKIRRIKCDELVPACRRCTSTGRRCDGYSSNVTSQSISDSQVIPVYRTKHPIEIRAFEFFIYRLVPGFTKMVDENFWHRTVPESSHTNPVVWDAVIAMSLLLQQWFTSHADVRSSNEYAVALQCYSRSIAGLRAHLDHEMHWSVICNITSILYICVECLQQNLDAASKIYRRALLTIHGINRPRSHEEASIGDAVKAFLHHMAASRGQLPYSFVQEVDPTHHFTSFRQARDALYPLIAEAHEYLCHVQEIKLRQAKTWLASPEIISRSNFIKTKLQRWYTTLVATKLSGHESEDEARTVGTLAYLQYYIYMSTLPSMYETAYDEHFDRFQQMVDCASQIVKTSIVQPIFSFETRLVPFLSFVAMKCRHPQVRRQAVSLLRTGPMIENVVWTRDVVAVAERIIEIEESESNNEHINPGDPPIPPETSRIFRCLSLEDGSLNIGQWQYEATHWFVTDSTVDLR